MSSVASAVAPPPSALNGLSVDTQAVNNVNTPITNGVNTSNNTDNGALSSAPDSPALLSPPTNVASPPVKIDLDYAQRESDARHEPLSLSIGKADDASLQPQLGTPADPGPFSCCCFQSLLNVFSSSF